MSKVVSVLVKRKGYTQLQEQLMPVLSRLKGEKLYVKPISQVLLRLPCTDEDGHAQKIQKDILFWMQKKTGASLPKDAWNGESFDFRQVGVQPCAAVNLPLQGLWMARQDDADKNVPSRTWVTEIGVVKTGKGYIEFGCRLQCVYRGDGFIDSYTIPKIVKDIVKKYPVELDGRSIQTQAWKVDSEDQADELSDFLQKPTRKRDVVVISTDIDSEDIQTCLISPNDFAWSVAGAVHVVAITSKAAYRLTSLLGKEFSVFGKAIRVYKSGFDPIQDDQTQHPLLLAKRIQSFEEANKDAKKSFLDWLSTKALATTVKGRILESEVPAFTDALRLESSQKLSYAQEQGASASELLQYALEDNQKLISAKELADALVDEYDEENKKLSLLNSNLEAELDAERARIRVLGDIIQKLRSNQPIVEAEVFPNSFDDLADWANQYLSGAVALTKAALKAAKSSPFEKPELAYKALIVLRDYYVPMKRGERNEASFETFHIKLAELGLKESGSLSESQYGRMGDVYNFTFEGRTLKMDKHLKGCNDREERYGFRLYYCWDDATNQIVVGSFPAHLKNKIS